MAGGRPRALTLIALLRMGKALFLVALAAGVRELMNPEFERKVHDWLLSLPLVQRNREFAHAAARATTASPHHLEVVAAAALAYAVLFALEGVGLWRRRVWAEYLTIAATTSFIPFEVYEIVRRFTLPRTIVLAGNVAIVAYLVVRGVRLHGRH
jgi:uncharacterized membrane protein (DUF2068 family)